MYYLGVDVGKTGGYAILDSKGKIVLVSSFDSWQEICKKTKIYRPQISSCAIEKVASKSGQGVKSIFTFGMNYGGWLAFLELTNISHMLVPPNRWQKMFLGSFPKGQSKARSLDFINRRFPHVQLKKTQHGISDAICIALYALICDRRITRKL